jgi:hypothetical protein
MAKMTPEDLRALLAQNPDVRVEGEPPRPAAVQAPQGPAPLEEAEQILVMGWANVAAASYPMLDYLIHVPNGGKRGPAEAARLKASGVRAGVPDLLLLYPCWGYSGLAIEMKRADHSNHATPEQREWLARLRAAGWAVAICYGAPEAIRVISGYCTGNVDEGDE